MNFADFWAKATELGMPADVSHRNLAMSAWDAALCAAQEQNFDATGKLRPSLEMADTLSRLHSWNQPTPPLS